MTIFQALQQGLITEQYYFSLLQAGVQDYIQGGSSGMPVCNPTHKTSTTVGGPGICCQAAMAAGGTPVVGYRVSTTNSKGQCIVCEVKQGRKGNLVWKRGKAQKAGSQVACATNQQGCCWLSGQ